jgi:hypothetical protein
VLVQIEMGPYYSQLPTLIPAWGKEDPRLAADLKVDNEEGWLPNSILFFFQSHVTECAGQ